MSDLYLHRQKVQSVFQLLGEHENDMTYSLGWALARCPSLRREFLSTLVEWTGTVDTTRISLQRAEAESGITDIEIESAGHFFLIGEAKRGWNLPSREQLAKYARRLCVSSSPLKRLVVISQCSRAYAESRLSTEVDGVSVTPFSWKDLAVLAQRSQAKGSHAEKRLLRDLLTYLKGLMTMQNIDSNWVYVVALGSGTPAGWGISWIDIVEKSARYFHPVGGQGWPKEPPNYIAFRYHGKLQSIHHIEGYDVVTNMHGRFPEIPDEEWGPFFLYTLGPAFAPFSQVPTGKIYPNGRVWCMLDTLFTSATISEARDASKARRAGGPAGPG